MNFWAWFLLFTSKDLQKDTLWSSNIAMEKNPLELILYCRWFAEEKWRLSIVHSFLHVMLVKQNHPYEFMVCTHENGKIGLDPIALTTLYHPE